MDIKQIPALIKEDLLQVEAEIHQRVDFENQLLTRVSQHICNSGGKRMRPMLLLLCAKLCGYTGPKSILYACVMEFIHVATLLHDDVIDGSETRRGTASANAKWGNNVPVLAGDYLYAMSNVILVEAEIPRIVALVSETIMHLTDGEILEAIKKNDIAISEEDYLSIIFKKTASLFCSCCLIGGVLGEVGPEKERELYNYGKKMGLAFQMMDDVLDFAANEKKLGKPIGNDLREGNLTIPIIRLLQKADPAEKERIRFIMENPGGTEGELCFVLELLDRYALFPAIEREARALAAEAKQHLAGFADSPYKDALLAVADYVVDRDH